MLFDYVTLKVIWWVLVGAVLILYSTTAGSDFGVTLLMPFLKRKARFADNDAERRVILNTIAPTWDGNQTWLVFAGGALFVIWPIVYATSFSGLYGAMLLILWSFFLRPPGFDYRSKLQSKAWRVAWDWGLFLSAFLPMLVFGLAVGNLFVGLPIHFNALTMRSFYDGDLFTLLTPFGLLCAFASLFMALMHGTAHLNRRTTGDLKQYFKRLHRWFSMVFLLILTIGGLMLAYHVKGYVLVSQNAIPTYHPFDMTVTKHVGAWFQSLNQHPWKWAGPIVAYVGVILALLTTSVGSGALAFWFSSLGVAGTVAMFGATLFPFLIPSSYEASQSLTVYNAVSAPYTLMGMFYISVVMLVIIFGYKLWGYGAVWRKGPMTVEKVKENSHELY